MVAVCDMVLLLAQVESSDTMCNNVMISRSDRSDEVMVLVAFEVIVASIMLRLRKLSKKPVSRKTEMPWQPLRP